MKCNKSLEKSVALFQIPFEESVLNDQLPVEYSLILHFLPLPSKPVYRERNFISKLAQVKYN